MPIWSLHIILLIEGIGGVFLSVKREGEPKGVLAGPYSLSHSLSKIANRNSDRYLQISFMICRMQMPSPSHPPRW